MDDDDVTVKAGFVSMRYVAGLVAEIERLKVIESAARAVYRARDADWRDELNGPAMEKLEAALAAPTVVRMGGDATALDGDDNG